MATSLVPFRSTREYTVDRWLSYHEARTQAPDGVVYTAVLNPALNLDLVLNLVLDKLSTRLGCLVSSSTSVI
jgi:hypothetical protein